MTRWIVPSIALPALLLVGAWLTGCRAQRADTEVTVVPPPMEMAPEPVPAGGEAQAHDVQSAYTYTCPMHPDVRQDRPGTCPECGMFLVADTDEAVEYYCPMHEDVVQDQPGKCPQCGMFLEARPAPEDAE